MTIEVLGVGNAFTSKYYNTSFLLRAERLILIDCPPGLFRLLRERRIDVSLIDDAIITHIHGDHCAGLETLVLWKKYVEGRRVRLWTTPTVFEELKRKVFPSFSDTFTSDFKEIVQTQFEDYVEFHPLDESGETRLAADVALAVRYNWHPTPTLGLKITCDAGSIGISGDTCYRPALLKTLLQERRIDRLRYEQLAGEWLWSCDLIYHEVEKGVAGPHTEESDLLSLPPDTRSRIRLIHLSDGFDEGRIPVAREGEIARFERPGRVIVDRP